MRCVFVGTSGFLGRIESETRVAFWADEPTDHGFDPKLLITVDLARCPSAASAGRISWDAVDVDDCYVGPHGGLAGTTLGPRWPEMQLAGAVYLEQRFLARLPDHLRLPEKMGGHAYEHMSVLYWPHVADPRGANRYAGHHAVIVEERGTLARVAVYPPGTSDSDHTRPLPMWIDLSAPDQCDAGPDSLTKIGTGSAPKEGALFLIAGRLPQP